MTSPAPHATGADAHASKLSTVQAVLVAELRDGCDGWSGDAFCISADIAALGAKEIERLAHMLWLRTHQLELQQKYWLRDAELALAGDVRAIRNRVEMSKLGPVEIVQS